MLAICLQKAAHIRRFIISAPSILGWEIREEHDDRIIRVVRYVDWHRVERARLEFAREAATLRESGWVEVQENSFGESVAETYHGFNLIPGRA